MVKVTARKLQVGVGSLLVCLLLTACQMVQGDFCDVAKPLRPTASQVDAMTDAQVRELLAHNRKGEKLCNWKA